MKKYTQKTVSRFAVSTSENATESRKTDTCFPCKRQWSTKNRWRRDHGKNGKVQSCLYPLPEILPGLGCLPAGGDGHVILC